MLVAGSVQLLRAGRSSSRRSRRRSSPATTSAPTRSSPSTLGFIPRHSVVEAVTDLLGADRRRRPRRADRPALLQHPLAGAAQRAQAAARAVRVGPVTCGRLITGGGGQLASDLEAAARRRRARVLARRARHRRRRRACERAFERGRSPTSSSTAPRSTTSTCASARRTARGRSTSAVSAVRERCAERGAKLVHLSTNYVFDGRRDGALRRGRPARPAQSIYALTKLAGEYAALAYGPARSSSAAPGCTACTAARPRAATSSSGWSRARASRAR